MTSFDGPSIVALGNTPIPGNHPCGADVAEDEQYITAVAELSKVGRVDLASNEGPDWYKVEQDCIQLLSSKTKDMVIAAALGHALFQRYSCAGLATALELLTAMVTHFWDNCFPPRPRRRKACIEALANRFVEQNWFRDNPPKPDDFDPLDTCVTRCDELIAALTAAMPDEPPKLAKFLRGLKQQAAKRPKPPATSVPRTGQAHAAAGGVGFSAGEIADTGSARKAILSACTFMQQNDLTDPMPYTVVRAVRWAKASLPTDDAGMSIESPEGTIIDGLTHQLTNGLWEHLLKNAEATFRTSDPLWLDLQRYVCTAMQNLGTAYDAAREAVISQTVALVSRLGEAVHALRFRNGTPLCGGATKMWLETAAPAIATSGSRQAIIGGNSKFSETSEKARKLASSGKLAEAIRELHEEFSACNQRRDRFLWRLCIAQLFVDAQRIQLASPLLEVCREEIRRHHIDEWEPSLAVDVAHTLYHCRKSLALAKKTPDQEALDGVRESFAWLCRLDPLAAMAAEPSGK